MSGIKEWFARRKDEADEAAARGKDEQRRMAGQAKHTANKVADKVRGAFCCWVGKQCWAPLLLLGLEGSA